ncbi:hypothetical protein NS365_16855 [Aureimonas ureilytica]|uniref:Uncharacterized protein n=1 Tax=Aureimonas ureilytica TaxID=401562 RepID=A0A175RJ86_9HYPH|nr:MULTISPECIES: hypothetical protein [Aureimonas]KTR03840.1 hypothetical protein NS365_16855 [Aureimonas ureilytica]
MKLALRLPSLILLVAGFVIWSSAFVVLYGALSVGCAFGWDTASLGPVSALRAVLIALWLAHLAALGALWWLCRMRAQKAGEADAFLGWAALHATWAAVVVTIVNYGPILGLTLCL